MSKPRSSKPKTVWVRKQTRIKKYRMQQLQLAADRAAITKRRKGISARPLLGYSGGNFKGVTIGGSDD